MNAPLQDPWVLHESAYRGLSSRDEKLNFLVRYAVLAPSNRNSQPWRFAVGRDQITLHAGLSRWQRVSDPNQRELYISLGCALENLLIALEHFGFGHYVTLCPGAEDSSIAAQVAILDRSVPSPFRTTSMFNAIVRRRTHHGRYRDRAVAPDVLRGLRDCNVDPDLTLFLTRDAAIKHQVAGLMHRGDMLALSDPKYREELAECIGSGNFGGPWLLTFAQRLAIARLGIRKAVARGSYKALDTSPVFGLISGSTGHRPVQMKAGQLLERLYLAATARGLSLQPISQLLESEKVRVAFARRFRTGGVPLIPFRLGYAKTPPHPTPRRRLEDLLAPGASER
jgi:nitroreductase